MTALKGRDVQGFLKAPGDGIVLALIYGPEQGLVHERAELVAKAVAEDLSDPWRVANLSDEDAADAAKLTDEAAAQSFLGGRRVVRVRSASAGVTSAVQSLLKAADAGTLDGAGLVVIEAGDLKKSSGLRKAAEASKKAVAIGCYAEGARDTMAAIREQCAEEGLSLDNEAAAVLTASLGDDRGLLRQEVEKLILYKGPKSVRADGDDRITAEDVAACLADAPQEDSFAIASLALSGQVKQLSAALAEAEASGTSVIALLRLAQNRILRLMPAAAAMAQGEGAGAAMKKIKPPVFYQEQDAVSRQLQAWPLSKLQRAAAAIYEAEAACKKTGAPDQAIAENILMRLAMSAAR
ncbi:DNA polymerase III subunit delta [Parvularcula sp. ZS-1/3]|uniref:DNA-directed DNA polymerase n=1 Tax=Parvularcula mediterranea TaxID=2732508 RepID=A0A7Y3RLD3_9PROT|nr:DNA polymerase III subunit delta [Parvularcula mediterranea]NNU15656.1 DNA polymerase III subunit delta [Parvularcula mediterranea]